MQPAERISASRPDWSMGTSSSEPDKSKSPSTNYDNGVGHNFKTANSRNRINTEVRTFASKESALKAPNVEYDPELKDTEEIFGSETFDCSHASLEAEPIQFDESTSVHEDLVDLPKTAQALRILSFLKDHLSDPFSLTRFTPPDISTIHLRNPALVATCEEWLPYIELAEPSGMTLLITPLYRFFKDGQVLTWIEVMATAKQLHVVLEFSKSLRRWVGCVGRTESPQDLLEKIKSIRSWTNDLEYILVEYSSCFKQYPNEIYYVSPGFLPNNSPFRSHFETINTLRNGSTAIKLPGRNEWEHFKVVKLPGPLTSNPDFISEEVSRFTFNQSGTLLAFRGAHQIIVLSTYTGAVVGTFQFPKREIVSVAFSPRSWILVISFTSSESQLLDLRSGSLIQEPSSSSTSNSNGVRRNNSASLGRGRKTLHSKEKSLELELRIEENKFSTMRLEEQTSAVGPDGIHALLTKDGILKVSDESGCVLFLRRIRVNIDPSKPTLQIPLTTLKRGMSERWRAGDTGSKSSATSTTSSTEKTPSIQPGVIHGKIDKVHYKCHNIGTRKTEDIVMDKLLQQSNLGTQESEESGFEITFNNNGMVAGLHTTNAFSAGFDILHIVNYSANKHPQLHVVYPEPPQSIAGYSINSEGDTIAICPQYLGIISIIRLSYGQEIYRLTPQQFDLSPFVGFSFAPGAGNTLLTAHSGKYAVYWNVNRLAESQSLATLSNSNIPWNGKHHSITPNGDSILLTNGTSGKANLFLLDSASGIQITPIKRPFFNQCRNVLSPVTIADDGNSAVVGNYLYHLTPKYKIKKLSIPKNSVIVRTAMVSSSTVAFAVLLSNTKSQLRVHNWSIKNNEFQDWTPPDTVLNIWGLAFDGERLLAVGVQLRSDGLDKFTVIFVARRKEGNLFERMRTEEWEISKPINLAFRSDGTLVILAHGEDSLQQPSAYSIFMYNVPLDAGKGFRLISNLRVFNASAVILPSMTSEGQIFYLGTENNVGWIMRASENGEDEKIAWCPLRWRSVGGLSLLCASKGDNGTVVCLNKVLGIALIKVGS